ncbi:MAG TPA: hypothetical protein PKA64_05900 [Myxococcota bacterium]|nr:hypothetical protein [Myxococcota bacterium]
MYRVILVPAPCGQQIMDVGQIEKNANAMHAEGYDLVQTYQTTTPGCTQSKSAVVMIFRRR